jgi:uncharacterized membrane protein
MKEWGFLMKYLSVMTTLLLVTYGQLIIKFEVNKLGVIPTNSSGEVITYLVKAITNIGILSGLIAAFIAALSWIAAMSKFELSSVYPFLSLNFILVPLLSVFLFNESFNLFKMMGITLICLGVFIFSRGI